MLSSSDIRSIYEAYASIYDESSIEEEFDILEELTDDEFQEIIEEVVYEMLDEGYDIDELEEIFDEELVEEIIDEAKVTMGRGGEAGGGTVTTGSGSRIAAQQRLDARKARKSAERKVARAETIKKAKKAVRDVVDKPAREYAAKRKIVPSKSGKQKLNISSLEGKQRTSAGRREVRKAVAKDVASRAVGKVKQAAGAVKTAAKTTKAAAGIAGSIAKDEARRAGRKAAHTAGKAAQAVKDAPGKAAGAAKRGLKGLIKRGAEKVARGAERVAKRMTEEVETYDVVIDFLISEGIAENLQEAQWMMVNEVDSEDIDTILEAYGLDEATAMAKRGYDETKLRKASGGGEAADRATSLENRPTYGDANKQRQRERYARAQRGDFRKTASSSPGLHGYAHKSNDPAVKAKQAARGAQRGALTPNEKKSFGR